MIRENRNHNPISLAMHLHSITIKRGVSSVYLVVGLVRENLHICLREIVRDTRKKDILPLVILKFMERSANPNS